MSDLFVLGENQLLHPTQRIACRNETKELQDLLERNHCMLPSAQIEPEDPPQWLLVKREMPVCDPATGSERWALDFLFVDHKAVPTLVECKRAADPRARREVVAQMIDYAANGAVYWSADQLLKCARETMQARQGDLEGWINRVQTHSSSAEIFFAQVQDNLRNGILRLVFFAEHSSPELRSMVTFLNGQMTKTDVLLVEARMYSVAGSCAVIPTLFGFTETAHRFKREERRKQESEATVRVKREFRESISMLNEAVRIAVDTLLSELSFGGSAEPGWRFGVGAIFFVPALQNAGCFAINRDAKLELFWGYWVKPDNTEVHKAFIRELHAVMQSVLGPIKAPGEQTWPKVGVEVWTPKARELGQAIASFVRAWHAQAPAAGLDIDHGAVAVQ